ncbi:MAG: AIR synthase family protein [Lunatimonas sp.]|uniref:AIR synthase family protein n=1 Tax=Lunatimonas sp. TaxID=2060141 RepID=UPI00263A4255|nr:AIR synthase family protein [Lunatimonas sp.]MCC5938296.1 AIR synthase family protein [Lunatimonas sp.]
MDNKLGKLGHRSIDELVINRCGRLRSEVRVGPQFGVDVSLVDLPGGQAMALTSDPLSLIPSLGLRESAWLSVHLMANDMATTGMAPMYGQFVLNLPATFSEEDFRTYWEYIHTFCSDIGVAITGGHTGFVEGQNSTIAGGGTFISIGPRERMLTSRSAQPGDTILVTKSCGISSAAILAMSFPDTVRQRAGTEIQRLASESFYHTSSLSDALLAVGEDAMQSGVTALHDVTEGGVLGAIYEMAVASGNGMVVNADRLPVETVQAEVCRIFDLDPRHCIGAGSMIITCRKEKVNSVIARLAGGGITCAEVGEIRPREDGLMIAEEGKSHPMAYSDTDPYWAAFFTAFRKGWK